MGILNSSNKHNHIKHNHDEYEADNLEDIVYDNLLVKSAPEDDSKEEELSKLVVEVAKQFELHDRQLRIQNGQASRKDEQEEQYEKTREAKRRVQEEEAKYDELLNSVQAQDLLKAVDQMNKKAAPSLTKPEKERFREPVASPAVKKDLDDFDDSMAFKDKAVDIPDVTKKPRQLESVNTNAYNTEEVNNYVRTQCEVMEEASSHIELAMKEYEEVTKHFDDVETIESAPDNLRKRIMDTAERVDNLAIDRRIVRSSEHKISTNTYHRLALLEDEIPKGLKYMQKQETYYETVKRDMRILEAERMSLRMEAKKLTQRQLRIQKIAFAGAIALASVFVLFFIALFAIEQDNDNAMLFVVVAFFGAALAVGTFALLKTTERQVLVTEIKLNKAMNLLNKTKIKYINAANTLDYEYAKYHVKSSYELGKKYEVYVQMKDERASVLKMTSKLNDAEQELLGQLRQLGLYEPQIWISQIKALYNKSDMVEVRHGLTVQRQKLRSQIEYNENRIEEAKANVKHITEMHPEFIQQAIGIIEQYEHKNM
jgi:hypothetical protein